MGALRWVVLAAALAGCAGSAYPGDALCEADGGCPGGYACTQVTEVLSSEGGCLASSGAQVCRAICPKCPAEPLPCGCVCP